MTASLASQGAQKLKTTGEKTTLWGKINEVVNVLCNLRLQLADSLPLTADGVMKQQSASVLKPPLGLSMGANNNNNNN